MSLPVSSRPSLSSSSSTESLMPSPSESASPSNNNPISEIVSSIYFVQFLLKSSKCWLSENTITVDMLSLWDTHCSQFWQISEKNENCFVNISPQKAETGPDTNRTRRHRAKKFRILKKEIFLMKVTFYFPTVSLSPVS